jgi:hypothetical protein
MPAPMEKRLSPTLEAAVLTALLALMGLSLFAAPGASRSGEVVITGRLHADASAMDDAFLVVEVDGRYCHPVRLTGHGRFTVVLPAGAEARFQFEKPGHVAKEVLIDTRNLDGRGRSNYKAHKVDFDVVLEPENALRGRAYTGPVGAIAFTKGSGTVQVQHHKRMTPKQDILQPVE